MLVFRVDPQQAQNISSALTGLICRQLPPSVMGEVLLKEKDRYWFEWFYYRWFRGKKQAENSCAESLHLLDQLALIDRRDGSGQGDAAEIVTKAHRHIAAREMDVHR